MCPLARWFLCCSLACVLLSRTAGAADWVLLFDDNGFATSNAKLPACRKLAELRMKGARVKCVAFTHKGGWAILFDQNGYLAHDLPPDAMHKLAEVAKVGGTLRWIAFTSDGGWCILSGKNTLDAGNVPTAIVDKVREIGRTGCTFRSLSFTPAGGCVLLFDKNGSWYKGPGLPEAACNKIVEVAKSGDALKTIAFTPRGGWSLFWEQNGSASEGVPDDALSRINEVGQAGGALTAIAYTQDGSQFDSEAQYVLESRPVRHIQVTLTTELALPNAKIEEWFIYAPQVPNLPGQRDVVCRFAPAGRTVQELSPLKRPVTLLRISDGRKSVHTALDADLMLYSRRLVRLAEGQTAPPVKDLTAEEAELYTRATATADYEAQIVRAWMQHNRLSRGDEESDLAFAHRVFACIQRRGTYQWPTDAHTASQVCATGKSDCGGLSAVFTAVMRANQVPARLLGGRWAQSQKGTDFKTHVKAEFFAQGIGWVPVDVSSALGVTNGENTFFGNDPGDFVTLMTDEDILVDSFVSGQHNSGVMQGILWWWRGSGSNRNSRFDEKWTVREQ